MVNNYSLRDEEHTSVSQVLENDFEFEDKKWILDRTIDFIGNVEQKTSILFAVVGVFAGLVISSGFATSILDVFANAPCQHVTSIITFAVMIIALFVAIILFVLIMFARLGKEKDSLIYFASIAAKDKNLYSEALKQGLSDKDISDQIHINSEICLKKYRLYNACLICVAISIMTCILLAIFLWLGV